MTSNFSTTSRKGFFNTSSFPYLFAFDNSDFLEAVANKQEEDQPNVTPDSSMTVNSKSDLENSLVLFQVMFILCAYEYFSLSSLHINTHLVFSFHSGDVYGVVQMERQNGAATDGVIKFCIWNAGD